MIQDFCLPNGLRVIFVPRKSTPVVNAMLAVKAGSRYESASINGLAHFAEHLFFKGSKNHPQPLSFATEVESLGARSNAFTSKEFTGFYIKSLSQHLPKTLDLLFDLVCQPLFRQEDIERELGVILEEIRMYRDSPREYVHTVYFKHIFSNHPLGADTAGEEETVRALIRESFLEYLKKYYRPDNFILCISGDFDIKQAETWVGDTFGSLPIPSDPIDPCVFIDPLSTFCEDDHAVLENKGEQAHLILGVRGLNHQDENRFTMDILCAALGNGMGSLLFSEVREKRSLAYYVYSVHHPFLETGTLFAGAGVDTKRINEAAKVIRDQFHFLMDSEISLPQLTRAKELVKGHLAIGLEDADELAWFYLSQALFQKEVLSFDQMLSRFDGVGVADVKSLAGRVFGSSFIKTAVVGPFSEQTLKLTY